MNKYDLNNIVVRTLSHANSAKKIISRTKEDNNELHEVSSETFNNRNGFHPVDTNNDILPAMAGKKKVKPQKGMRKYKGSDTIRKNLNISDETDLNNKEV